MKLLFKAIAVFFLWSFVGFANTAIEPIFDFDERFYIDDDIPRDFSPSNIGTRLELVEGVIDLEYSRDAEKLIRRYMLQGRNDTKKLIERSFYYFPMFDEYFERYKVPKELKYITLLESALKPTRRSAAGAKGLWQFMPETAKWMGLAVNTLEDERTDPAISTEAAVRYLDQLHQQFGDWNLVLLAYNAGPGALKRAIRKAQSQDVEDLIPYLPKQTRKYIPFYTATVYALNYYSIYKISPQPKKVSLKVNEEQWDMV